MANSKSNIYPIQLQGAELCLNRYDAEIKQYSGFNKNNSPFVGGCLSNVFTKEEQISGGNADNTYIDTNGDVYRVDAEGVYKNEDRFIKYPSTVKFYEKEEVKLEKNVVYAISDKIYITVEEGLEFPRSINEGFPEPYIMAGYVAHWGDDYSAVLCSVRSVEKPFFDVETKNGKIVFSIKRYVRDLSLRGCIHIIYVPDENESQSFKYDPTSTFILARPDGEANSLESGLNSQSIYIAEDYFLLASNNSYENFVFCLKYNNPSNLIYSDTFTTEEGANYIYDKVHLMTYATFKHYYMTNEGIFYFIGCKNLNKNTYTFDISSDKYYVNSFKLVIDGNNFKSQALYSQIYLTRAQANGKTIKNVSSYGIFAPWGCSYNSFFAFDGDSETKGLNLSFCNNIYNLAVHNDNNIYKNATGAAILKNGFKILIYNNKVVNISIMDMHKDSLDNYTMWVPEENFNGVIIEEWNKIEYFYINDNYIFYKVYDGGFYCVKEGFPKILLKDTQLIVNCNYEKNCYDLRDKEVKHFGSDWVCEYLASSLIHLGQSNSLAETFVIEKNLPNNYWVASSVNEYKQKYNPSLLLNMQGVIYNFLDKFLYDRDSSHFYISFVIYNYITNGCVNVYFGEFEQNAAYYWMSGAISMNNNPELKGLPYPNNTDGNVQYNPSLFSQFITNFSTDVFVRENADVYQLLKSAQVNIMSYFLGTLIEGLERVFIIQGQYYGIINNKLFSIQFNKGVIADTNFVVNVQGLQFVGNTPYEALFFSKTNRCLYSFTGANVLSQKQLVDKISEVRNYLYNPATQTVFLITDIGIIFYGLFGIFLLEYTNITKIFLLDNGIVLSDNLGNYRYIKYYLDEGDTGYTKENIRLETCFYGMNNETVTINDCLYFRIFSEEHEEGDLKVSATTISLSGRKTEDTTFKIKASDWDKITHTIYLRYQPKTQRGLGVSFSIDSPFKIASMSVGSQPDAILVDKVSKGAINAPSVTSNNDEW